MADQGFVDVQALIRAGVPAPTAYRLAQMDRELKAIKNEKKSS